MQQLVYTPEELERIQMGLLALLCWAAALVSLPMGLVGLLSNFGVVFTV